MELSLLVMYLRENLVKSAISTSFFRVIRPLIIKGGAADLAFLDTKIRKSQAKSLESTDGKLGKSGLNWKFLCGFYRGK